MLPYIKVNQMIGFKLSASLLFYTFAELFVKSSICKLMYDTYMYQLNILNYITCSILLRYHVIKYVLLFSVTIE